MIYIFGRLFFPNLLHSERRLRTRIKLVAVVCGLLLMTAVVVLVVRLNHSRILSGKFVTPSKQQFTPPAR